MGRSVNSKERIIGRTIGFKAYQIDFFDKHKTEGFKPDEWCREAIDQQIKLIDPNFIPVEVE